MASRQTETDGDAESGSGSGSAVRIPAAERRAAALVLVGLWQELVRDLLVAGAGIPGAVHDPDLLEDLEALERRLPPRAAAGHLRRLEMASERLAGNVSPELVLDVLAVEWVV